MNPFKIHCLIYCIKENLNFRSPRASSISMLEVEELQFKIFKHDDWLLILFGFNLATTIIAAEM